MRTTRRTVVGSIGAIAVSGLGTAAYGFGVEAPSTRVTRYRLTPPGWPTGYKLTAAAIADLHVVEPWMGLKRLAQIVDTTNAMGADVIFMLGDYVAGRRIEHLGRHVEPRAWAAELGRLKAPLGVYAVQGNHDWWNDYAAQARRAGPTKAQRALESVGIPVLENRAQLIKHAGGAFWIAGLADQWAFFHPRRGQRLSTTTDFNGVDDLAGTMAQVIGDQPVILLAHEPDIFPRVPGRVSLTLSGHTHGGQITLLGYAPVVPSRYGDRYVYGHIVENNRHLIVSAGLGCSGVPVRIGAPPEIVRIELGV